MRHWKAERFQPIEGYPDHEVSTWGRVRSYRGLGSKPKRLRRPRLLKPTAHSNGYLTVSLGGRKTYVHRIVLETFVGPCPPGMQGAHSNDDGHDNRLDNVSWQTPANNGYQRTLLGTSNRGEKNGHARLTEADIPVIRRLGGSLRKTEIGAMFGVSRQAITDVLAGRTWTHVPAER